jgi:uncharacterized membrane protein
MMSQNRQEKRDRLRADQDYKVNLKAELEVRCSRRKSTNCATTSGNGFWRFKKSRPT